MVFVLKVAVWALVIGHPAISSLLVVGIPGSAVLFPVHENIFSLSRFPISMRNIDGVGREVDSIIDSVLLIGQLIKPAWINVYPLLLIIRPQIPVENSPEIIDLLLEV